MNMGVRLDGRLAPLLLAFSPGVVAILCVGALLGSCNDSGFKGRAESRAAARKLHSLKLEQSDYQTKSHSFQQGKAGTLEVHDFDQGKFGALDVLVVIDNSGSMKEEQANLAGKLQPLLSKVANADWQIAVTTTDPSDPCLRGLIKKGEAGVEARFASAVNAGTAGSGIEQGFFRAREALDGSCSANENWLRDGSTLAVLIVSDEDNCHIDTASGYGCVGAPHADASYLLDYLEAIRTPKVDAKVYGLIWHPTIAKSQCSDALKEGNRYAQIIADTEGTFGSICEDDYTSTLEAISNDVAKILQYEVDLQQSPDAGSVEVKVDGKPFSGFTVEGRKVRFVDAPPFGSKVSIGYSHGAQGEVIDAVVLPSAAAIGSLKVAIDGVDQEAEAATLEDDATSVTFSEPPADGATLVLTYAERDSLPVSFAVPKDIDPTSLLVKVNGVEVTPTYDGAAGTLTFSEAPPAKASIELTYFVR